MSLTIRTITAEEHRVYVASRMSVPLQQTPGWGKGFVSARTESVGWFDDGTLIGAGLFRYRGLPRLPMRSVAVFESGPDIDWAGRRRARLDLQTWLDPLIDHLRDRGVFTVRINPVVATREWQHFDPHASSDSQDLVPHAGDHPLPDSVVTQKRLSAAGWRPMHRARTGFFAEVPLGGRPRAEPGGRGSDSVVPGLRVRPGTPDDLEPVQHAVEEAHPGIPMPSLKDLQSRWHGLASDDLAGVHLLVVEQQASVVYGGLYAVVGNRAWDLSPPLPLPDADQAPVQLLRRQMMVRSAELGARTLAVPTVSPERDSPVETPAPGWPPVHLVELMGTWQFPVRATWHSVLAPVVDRLML